MAGALTERDFVAKLHKTGFEDVRIHERHRVGIDELAHYPLFTPELLELMRRLISPARRDALAAAIVVSARSRAVGPSARFG